MRPGAPRAREAQPQDTVYRCSASRRARWAFSCRRLSSKAASRLSPVRRCSVPSGNSATILRWRATWPSPHGRASEQISSPSSGAAPTIDAGAALIDRDADARFITDHIPIQQPSVPRAPPGPWADLQKVVDLAKRKNAVIKISGACTLAKQPYPFPDIWDPLKRIFDAWVSNAACGGPTGRAPSASSITSRRPSPSSRPTG